MIVEKIFITGINPEGVTAMKIHAMINKVSFGVIEPHKSPNKGPMFRWQQL
jgi:hypothetical protein